MKREAAGLQQKPVSRSLGKPEQYVNKVEHGRQRIDVIEFLDLCSTLGLDQDLTLRDLFAAAGFVEAPGRDL
jgi:transcriptional regulator with XRE-family HTH domain